MSDASEREAVLARTLEALPVAVLVVEPEEYRILAVSDAYAASTGRTRAELLGEPAFAMFPPDPADPDPVHVASLRASLARAVATRAPDILPALRYPVQIDGRFVERTWRIINVPVFAGAGRLTAIAHVVQNVTELPVSEASANALIRATFDSAAVGIAIGARDGTIVMANEAVCATLGCTEGGLVGRPIAEVIHPADWPDASRRYREIAAGTSARARYVARFVRRDGTIRWMRVTMSPLRTGDPAAYEVVAVIEDFTAEHMATEGLREKSAMLRIAGHLARVGGSVVYPDGRVYWSDEIAEMLEFPPGTQFSLEEALDLYPEEWRPIISGAIGDAFTEGTPVDVTVQLRTRSGQLLWVRVQGEVERAPDGSIIRLLGAVQDVTAPTVAANRLRASEERFQLAVEGADVLIWDWDVLTGDLYISPHVQGLLGHDPAALAPRIEVFWELLHPDDLPPVTAALEAHFAGTAPYDLDLRFRMATGEYRWCHATGRVVRAADGQAVRMLGSIIDISARKAAEERLAEQAALLDETSDAIIVRDLAHRVLFWNRGAERLYGWTAAEAVGEVMVEAGFPDRSLFESAMAEVLTRGEWAGELLQRTRGGTPATVFSRWTLRRDASGQPTSVLVIDSDVTERRRLERQFLRSQRLESLGTLAGGIAHDLNNALAPILMGVEYLRDAPSAEERAATLDALEASARRGASMVRQVLTFARGIEGERAPLAVPSLLAEVAKIAEETFLKEVEVVQEVAEDLPPVLGDATQLHQVLINLCVNARDAMPAGGRLTLAARQMVVTVAEQNALHELRPGRYVLIEVRDTGVGIPPDVFDRIFEPFFTTKALGEGTGLGLSTTKSIVEAHGGAMRIGSAQGTGTIVSVWLPAAEGGEAASPPPMHPLPHGHGELLLVVDDEPAVRDITRRTLERFGYRVVTAGGADEALHAFRAGYEAFAAVITDMMMPGMDGAALIAELRRRDPGLRVIAVSGLQGQGAGVRSHVPPGVHYLAKPFATAELLQLVQDVLTNGPDGASAPP